MADELRPELRTAIEGEVRQEMGKEYEEKKMIDLKEWEGKFADLQK